MDVSGRLPLVELERLERAERDAAKAPRHRIVILSLKDDTAPVIAMSLVLGGSASWVLTLSPQRTSVSSERVGTGCAKNMPPRRPADSATC